MASHLAAEQGRSSLNIDSLVGGLGDVWMRLSALYSLVVLLPSYSITLRIPSHLMAAARVAFADRLRLTHEALPDAVQFSHLGLRHLLGRSLRGQRFICPFTRLLEKDRLQPTWKRYANSWLFAMADRTGLIRQPTPASVESFQGFHEFTALRPIRNIVYEDFLKQSRIDFQLIRQRLRERWPVAATPELECLVFPSGTGHQIMPPAWAKSHLPNAAFAFHVGDGFQGEYEKLGLRIMRFTSTEGLFELAAQAKRIVVTDSFPSHPCQSYSAKTIVVLTQQPRHRIVHPIFDGVVIASAATCCPCPNTARGYGRCAANRDYCITWETPSYHRQLLHVIG